VDIFRCSVYTLCARELDAGDTIALNDGISLFLV
jgi:hypothetical protein